MPKGIYVLAVATRLYWIDFRAYYTTVKKSSDSVNKQKRSFYFERKSVTQNVPVLRENATKEDCKICQSCCLLDIIVKKKRRNK